MNAWWQAGDVDGVEALLGEFEVGFRSGEHRVVVDGAGEHGGDAVGLAGGFLFDLLFVGVEQVGFGLGEFGLGEAVIHARGGIPAR